MSGEENAKTILSKLFIQVKSICMGKSHRVRELQQITSVSLLSSHSVTDDANNEHFILSRSTSSHTTEMKYIGCDELQDSDLSWQANRINTNEQLADVALINRSETKDELVQCVWTRFKTLKALD